MGWACRQHTAALEAPRPRDSAPHSAPRSPSKSRADHERTQPADQPTDLFSTSCCAPYRLRGRNRSLESVATNGCKRDTVRGGAVATDVSHPLMGEGSCVRTVESRRATRRCLIPRGTASPGAVPQRSDCLCHLLSLQQFLQRVWSRMQRRTLCWTSGTRRGRGR
jgi:hypothetical protein